MLHRFLRNVEFYSLLLACDKDLAAQAQELGCRRCSGQLHQAHYRRKPRGGPDELDGEFRLRFSFCCYFCRKRLTPASLRFLGQRVYLGAILVFISAMLGDASPSRRRRLQTMCGADARTLGRWRQWWSVTFSQTAVWKTISPRLALVRAPCLSIPRQLLRHLTRGSLAEAILGVLRLLLPLSSLSGGGGSG